GGIRDIHRMRPGLAPKRADFRGGFLGIFRRARNANHIRAFRGKFQRYSPADSPARAGHNRNLILKLFHWGQSVLRIACSVKSLGARNSFRESLSKRGMNSVFQKTNSRFTPHSAIQHSRNNDCRHEFTGANSRLILMADLKFFCPQCRQKIQCEPVYAGSQINCPSCQQTILVPTSSMPAFAVPPGERVIQIKIATLKKAAMITAAILLVIGLVFAANALFNKRIVLTGNHHLNSPQALRPPVEITLVAKTDSTNLRMAYAANQVIFNWEVNPDELRIE